MGAPTLLLLHGWVASAGTHIYLAVPKEQRFCLPNTRFMIHQPLGGVGGRATDIRIEAEEILCLERSLVLEAMLRAQGQTAKQRFGVRRTDGEIQAHAWVETDVGAIGERPDALGSFAPLDGVNST